MKIAFMGTPDFAVHVLDAIIKSHHQVVGVVTTPDKPAGRGQRMRCSAVKEYALSKELPILQPVKMRDEGFISQLKSWGADLFVVVAFRMLPKEVYTLPAKGAFNVHASLLPQYRGAAPIQWAIINGERETGVTTFFLDEHTDTGAVIRRRRVAIGACDTAGDLHDRLMVEGAKIALETLDDIERGQVQLEQQETTDALKPAPKIFKEDMHIQWDDTAENIYNRIRGLSPYPAAYSLIRQTGQGGGKDLFLKIYQCAVSEQKSRQKPGTLSIINGNMLTVCTQNYDITIENLQLEGKKRMTTADFLKGFHFENYTDYLF